jgi:hypothetical protein
VCHLTLMISFPSHRTFSSLSPRIPRTQSSRSSVCTKVLGHGTVQFGTAAIVHNGSERPDGRMYRNTSLQGVAPQKTAILITPPNFPYLHVCRRVLTTRCRYVIMLYVTHLLQKYIRCTTIHFMHWVHHRHCK